MKKLIIILIVVILAGIGGYFLFQNFANLTDAPKDLGTTTDTTQATTTESANATKDENKDMSVIGTSVEGREITAYHFGTGDTELLFVGGIHGGYEWNTALVAYELVDYLKENPNVVPESVQVTVIPVLNPDGLNKVVTTTGGRFAPEDVSPSIEKQVSGRFNGNTVDLNRNFDCDWQAAGKWQTKTVSGGITAFSEPESQAIKEYVKTRKPDAAIVWYSAAGGVFASNCHNGVLSETRTLVSTYAKASGYPAYESFDFYEITGDMVNWLAKENIPAISVLLSTHTDVEWAKNQAGIKALLEYYAK